VWIILGIDVPCNLASPWLYPVLEEALGGTSVMNDDDQELLTLIGVIRRLNLGALWIGAVASGLDTKIVQKVREAGHPLTHLHLLSSRLHGCCRLEFIHQ
jgi:hypothetical protein